MRDAAGEGVAEAVVRFLDNTARTTVRRRGKGDTFVMTGDIPAMWLRDSCAQLSPLLRLVGEDETLGDLIGGLLATHWRMILIDPYANAFNEEANSNRWDDDEPEPSPWVWERKFEIDSLAYPIDLAARLLATGNTSWITADTLPALEAVLEVLETETHHEERSTYTFVRRDCPPTDTLVREGRGRLTEPCGLVWQGFRPSDDACALGYNIPGNLFMASALRAVPALVEACATAGFSEAPGEQGEGSDVCPWASGPTAYARGSSRGLRRTESRAMRGVPGSGTRLTVPVKPSSWMTRTSPRFCLSRIWA